MIGAYSGPRKDEDTAFDVDLYGVDGAFTVAVARRVELVPVPFVVEPFSLPPEPRLPANAPVGPRGPQRLEADGVRAEFVPEKSSVSRRQNRNGTPIAYWEGAIRLSPLAPEARLSWGRPDVSLHVKTERGAEIEAHVRRQDEGNAPTVGAVPISFMLEFPKEPSDRCVEFLLKTANLCLESQSATVDLAVPKRNGTVTDRDTGITIQRPIEPDRIGHGGTPGYRVGVPPALFPDRDDRWHAAVTITPLNAQGEALADMIVGNTAIQPTGIPGSARHRRAKADSPLIYEITSYGSRDNPIATLRVRYPVAGKVVSPAFAFRDIGWPRLNAVE